MAMKYIDGDGNEMEVINMDEYDTEEIYEGCTVQVLRNSKTGAISYGWWIGGIEDMPVIGNPYGLLS